MEVKVQKVGNSSGVIIPKRMLASLNVSVGQKLEIESSHGEIHLRRKAKSKTLDDILSQCDESAPKPADAWGDSERVGSELL